VEGSRILGSQLLHIPPLHHLCLYLGLFRLVFFPCRRLWWGKSPRRGWLGAVLCQPVEMRYSVIPLRHVRYPNCPFRLPLQQTPPLLLSPVSNLLEVKIRPYWSWLAGPGPGPSIDSRQPAPGTDNQLEIYLSLLTYPGIYTSAVQSSSSGVVVSTAVVVWW